MRYLAYFSDYLKGIRETDVWQRIFYLLLQLDVLNGELEGLDLAEERPLFDFMLVPLNKKPVCCSVVYEYDWPRYRILGLIAEIKGELVNCYGINVDKLLIDKGGIAENIQGQISIDDLLYSMNPAFGCDCIEYISVHP